MNKSLLKVLLLTGAITLSLSFGCKSKPIYLDTTKSIDERAKDLVSKLTLEEKILLISGDTTGFDTREIKRLGIPPIRITDGPVGVRNGNATAFPSAVSAAASWDTILVDELAKAMAKETKAKGRSYLLGPCVCIQRMPLGGRNFETYSEDPYLASRLAVNWVKGLQSEKVISSVKHFATNDQEWQRNNYDVNVDERTLREVHLFPFEAAVKEGGAMSVMAAYNIQNGQHCTENYHLIKDVLKGEWKFQGFLISDWVSVYNTVDAANAGLDLEMPVGVYFRPDSIMKYMKEGKITEETINDKVYRLMRAAIWAGLLDNPQPADTSVLHSEPHKVLALRAALESITLLKNEGNILPIDTKKVKTIAVIGPTANYNISGGGGSSHVDPYYHVTALEGIKKRFGSTVNIVYAAGDSFPKPKLTVLHSDNLLTPDKKSKGLQAEYFSNTKLEGKPVITRIDSVVNFDYGAGSPDKTMKPDFFSARWTGWVKTPESGNYAINTISDDGVRLYINDKKVFDNWTTHGPSLDQYTFKAEAGKEYKVCLEYFEEGGGAIVQLGMNKLQDGEANPIQNAAKLAASADIAIVFAGAVDMIESEGRDREGLELPGKQEELIKAVEKANPNTIVVLTGGTATNTKPWLAQTKGLIHMYYSGQEAGNAIASILSGDVNPAGKLPFSFINSKEQSPAFNGYMDKSLKVEYKEGVFVGYKYLEANKLEPTFPFGFGLSYTTFEYSNIKVNDLGNKNFEVSVDIKNIGKVAGYEIAQLYLSDKECSVPRPLKELKGFSKIKLQPGEIKTVKMKLKERDFAFWDVISKGWKVEPGEFEVLVGTNSRDIKLTEKIDLK